MNGSRRWVKCWPSRRIWGRYWPPKTKIGRSRDCGLRRIIVEPGCLAEKPRVFWKTPGKSYRSSATSSHDATHRITCKINGRIRDSRFRR